ncbi:BA14K family protein [Aurantimonas sp. 22II-16-19i]|uniref:BA14K family protein n=1 Tax=Aurantimonas sp. 22II-16-19i TaxID=1317114 RepID=UPI0009F7DFE7|nr:BA14K family protein [Aurantimonas sp. 22II-16-19i]ORE98321.1 hypothetical protein ATO4_05037 [Aurantimonas sp. 22II-16-19i]
MPFAPKPRFSLTPVWGRLSLTAVVLVAALAAAPVTLPAGMPILGVTPAEAGHRHHRRWHRHHHDGIGIGAAAVIGGILGLGLGIAIAEPRYYHDPYYHGPRPLYRVSPRAYRHGPRPWSRAWYRYCHARYRSFDARSGTFQPYHGPRQMCR